MKRQREREANRKRSGGPRVPEHKIPKRPEDLDRHPHVPGPGEQLGQ